MAFSDLPKEEQRKWMQWRQLIMLAIHPETPKKEALVAARKAKQLRAECVGNFKVKDAAGNFLVLPKMLHGVRVQDIGRPARFFKTTWR